jgi:hypothetical protein
VGCRWPVFAGEGEVLNSTISANPTPATSGPGTTAATPIGTCALGVSVASPLRAAMLLAGAVGCGLLSVWIWMIGRENGRFVLLDHETKVATLPNLLVVAAGLGAVLGVVGVVWASLKDARLRASVGWCVAWAKSHPKLALLLAAVAAFGAIDLYEVFLGHEPRHHDPAKGLLQHKTMLREDAEAWLLFTATVMAALAISAARPWCSKCQSRVGFIRRSMQGVAGSRRWLLVAFLVPAVLGSAMSLGALEGVPHFSDSLTYQMQGRMLYAGQMTMPAPLHDDLFTHSLFFVKAGEGGDARYFGKYPIGWPAILGFFDNLGVGFMANAVLAGIGALLTYGLARQVTTRRIAVLAAVLLALNPWAWFNAAHFASHAASMIAVNAFLFFFLRVVNARPQASFGSAMGAGLCLGAAILIRPFDAGMFALPAVIASFIFLARDPRRWLAHGLVIAIATGVGISIYMWSNVMTTGQATLSPYKLENRWNQDWNFAVTSILHRVQFQWAELNDRFPGFGVGGLTLATIGAIVAMQRGRFSRSPALTVIVACNALFFISNAPFLFTNVWWGPRWLLPVTPLLAILLAEFVNVILAAAATARQKAIGTGAASAAQLAFMLLAAGTFVSILLAYPGKWYQHRIAPPHNVSGAADQRVASMGLNNVIVGMPLDEELRAAKMPNRAPFDPRAGMVFMKAPFESNPVIYVRKVENWAAKAKECYPSRQLFELIADKEAEGGFVIRAVP